MKTITPIKRHPAIVSFSKEHHFGLLLVWKIRQGLKKSIPAERISNYVLFFFREDLDNHFKEEEQLLFSKLPAGDELRIKAERDHLEIYQLVDAIKNNKTDAGLLSEMADKLEEHIRFEERELFNHLQTNISADDLKEIEKRFSNTGNGMDEKWEDHFWEIQK
jgi:iron-sulfur cluster repair protein YtfE (RIC family)